MKSRKVFFSLYIYTWAHLLRHICLFASHMQTRTRLALFAAAPLSSLEVERKPRMNNERLAIFKPQASEWVLWG